MPRHGTKKPNPKQVKLTPAMDLKPQVTPTHVFFYGHQTGHELDCLCQWYTCRFVVDKEECERFLDDLCREEPGDTENAGNEITKGERTKADNVTAEKQEDAVVVGGNSSMEAEKPYNTNRNEDDSRFLPKDQGSSFKNTHDTDSTTSLSNSKPIQANLITTDLSTTSNSTTITFTSTEQYMMYAKARLMHDTRSETQMLHPSMNPREAKRLGKKVTPWNSDKWFAHCDAVVENGNLLKFSQNEKLGRRLLNTGSRVLVEASPRDRIWGVGLRVDEAEGREAEWGENRLGRALMRVRERLRGDYSKDWGLEEWKEWDVYKNWSEADG